MMLRIVAPVACVIALVAAPGAHACSCAVLELERDVPRADAAVVGTVERHVVSRDTSDMPGAARTTVEIEQVVTGRIDARRIDVLGSSGGGVCGLEVQRGDRIGLLLRKSPDGWHSSLCNMADPDALRAYEGAHRPPGLFERLAAFLRSLCATSTVVAGAAGARW